MIEIILCIFILLKYYIMHIESNTIDIQQFKIKYLYCLTTINFEFYKVLHTLYTHAFHFKNNE